jgi:hypothetical protein
MAPEDPYTALPPDKNRRRGGPPPSLSLDAVQNCCGHLSSRAAGGWDIKEEYEGGKPGEEKRGEGTGGGREEDERRCPRIGLQ